MSDTIVPITTKKDWTSDQEVRWCPGCGDYAHPAGRPDSSCPTSASPARTPCSSPASAARSRFPYYMNTYGIHTHPRPRPGDRHRPRRRPARPRRVGHHRRRRRPVDRRQPPHPRPAPQRQPHDPAVQQPDLRPDQGPVLADVASSARSPSRRRSARSTTPFNPLSRGPRRRGHASSPARTTSTAST